MTKKSDPFILNDQQIFPMCLMPPEQHYPSVEALVRDMTEYQSSRKNDDIDSIPGMTIPEGSFDKVKCGSSYVLIPSGVDYSFLFRGQGAYHTNCRPSLWRGNKSDKDVFICHLKVAEFELMLRHFPMVSYFESQAYHVNYEGLAQHYGLETAILDLTSDLSVALFFAMCDEVGDEYHPKIDESKTYIGYLYVIFSHRYCQSMCNSLPILFKEKLVPIGQQPFKRPGAQKGYGLKMQKDETLYGYLYSFSYTAEDSRTIFKHYNYGKYLWTEDPIIERTASISNTDEFSYEAVALTTKRYRGLKECFNFSCNRMVKKLKAEGYKIVDKRKLPWYISIPKTPLTSVEQEDIERKIFFQTIYSKDKTFDKDLRVVTESDSLRLLHGGFDAPIGYASGIDFLIGKVQGKSVQSYRFSINKIPAKPNDEGKILLDWQKNGQQAPRVNHFTPISGLKQKVCYVPNGV